MRNVTCDTSHVTCTVIISGIHKNSSHYHCNTKFLKTLSETLVLFFGWMKGSNQLYSRLEDDSRAYSQTGSIWPWLGRYFYIQVFAPRAFSHAKFLFKLVPGLNGIEYKLYQLVKNSFGQTVYDAVFGYPTGRYGYRALEGWLSFSRTKRKWKLLYFGCA